MIAKWMLRALWVAFGFGLILPVTGHAQDAAAKPARQNEAIGRAVNLQPQPVPAGSVGTFATQGDFTYCLENNGQSQGAPGQGEADASLASSRAEVASDYSPFDSSEPASYQEHFQRAYAEEKDGNYSGAITEYDQAALVARYPARVLCNRGGVKKAIGDLEGALADLNRALELDPKLVVAYADRGNLKQQMGDRSGAITDCNHAVQIDPKSVNCHLLRAFVERAQGNNPAAEADYTAATVIDPRGAAAYERLGLLKRQAGRWAEACADYNQALFINPKYAVVYLGRAEARTALGQWSDALGDYRRYCELSKQRLDYAHLYSWVCLARLGQTVAGDQELSAYLAQLPEAVDEAWVKKIGGFLLGKATEAELFAAAITTPDAKKERSQHCEAFYFIGVKKMLAGERKDAAEEFRRCLSTELKTYNEYGFAKAELMEMGEIIPSGGSGRPSLAGGR